MKVRCFSIKCAFPLSRFVSSRGEDIILPTGIESWYDPKTETRYYNPQKIPCGSCVACRVNHAANWQARIIMELQYYEKASFLTLTYDDEHLPRSAVHPMLGTLCKEDIQKFFKRLRKKYPDNDIRYFVGAEYGTQTARPHYHAIVFGYFPEDASFYKSDKGNTLYLSDELIDIWKNGHVIVGQANALTAGYVSKYVTTKLKGMANYSTYIDNGLLPPFQLASRNPAIGRRWYEDNKEQLLKYDFISLPYMNGAKEFAIPDYFYYLLEQDFPEETKQIKYNRSLILQDLEETEEYYYPTVNVIDKMINLDYLNICKVNKRS